MLISLYTYYADYNNKSKPTDPEYSQLNGHAVNSAERRPMNGHAQMPNEADRAIQDAEEFELDGLMTDDEDEAPLQKQNGSARR